MPRFPCDATRIGRFRNEAGVEEPTRPQRRWLKRRQAVGVLYTVFYAAGYNFRWRLRAMVRLGPKAAF